MNKDDVAACVPHLFAAIEDRTADVRKAAQDATLGFMIQLGYDNLARQTGKLKPASKSIVIAHLDKVRPNLPAKPAAPAVVAPVAATAAAPKAKVAAQSSRDLPKEEDDAGKAPPGKVLRAPSKAKVILSVVRLLEAS